MSLVLQFNTLLKKETIVFQDFNRSSGYCNGEMRMRHVHWNLSGNF